MPNTIVLLKKADAKAGLQRAVMSTMVTELAVRAASRREVRATPMQLLKMKIRFNSTLSSLAKRISDDKSGVEASRR